MVETLSAKRKALFTMTPAFARFQVIALTDPKLATVKIRKMSQAFSYNQNSFNNTSNTFNYITPDDESEILAWLSPLESRARHRDIGAQRVDSIGAWLLETQQFRRWHNGNLEDEAYHPALFCHGIPGAGKSYIM